MKNNQSTISPGGPTSLRESYPMTNDDVAIHGDGLWMEFEDSFIQILSGAEPFRKYYQASEIEQLHLA